LIEFLPVHAQDISKTAPDVIFGAVLIAVMILLPAGVAPLIKRLVGAIPRSVAKEG
jgi:hypothetical protein